MSNPGPMSNPSPQPQKVSRATVDIVMEGVALAAFCLVASLLAVCVAFVASWYGGL